ncbi:unnamed protein product [Phytophthora lilii]|uniref:Unnamed protein product n=1 Tax=Phytophthora lilii TaxID=2077276 RepID=A0A9W6TU82_9STRA|nr:unnamed protein product [Phytophthora lilii]
MFFSEFGDALRAVEEYQDVVSKNPPTGLPPDRGVRHEIDLVPGTKYCVTRQWPLPKEQCDVIDAFFSAKHAAGMVREIKSAHSTPTFCVIAPNGKWRIVHAFNKLNAATIPGRRQSLGRMFFRTTCTPSGMLWEWLVMPQGLSNAPATFNRLSPSCPILALPDPDGPFSVVCDASDFAIGSSLLQDDAEGRERVVAFESRQLKAAEKDYPVNDKELLAMKYALVKFRVHLLGSKPFVIYTDHASLPTATQSPHLSQRMARWLSFFAEYNFEVKYKPGRQNPLADALSRRDIVTDGADPRGIRHGHFVLVVPHDEDLKSRILYETHDTPYGGHLGREKTYSSVRSLYWWPKLYQWTSTYVRTCETCQRVKPSPYTAAPSASLPVPSGLWQSVRMDFAFGLPKDSAGNTGIVVFVDRLSKMAHLAAVPDTIDGEGTASLFLDRVFRQHGLPEAIVSDRDPRFRGNFWTAVFKVLDTRLDMSTADHPQTDGQTERVNRVVEDVLRSVCAEMPKRWSALLPVIDFA